MLPTGSNSLEMFKKAFAINTLEKEVNNDETI